MPDVEGLVSELRGVMPGAAGLDLLYKRWRAVDADYLSMTIPSQICHLDFAPSNVLIHDGRVTAVLDFEIAGWDLRAADVVAALLQCANTTTEEETFLSGFRSRLDLTEEAWAAVPVLRELRQLSSVVWRAGRWREGKATLDEVRSRLAILPG